MEKCNSYEPGRKTNNAAHMDLEECKQYIAHGLGRNLNNAVHMHLGGIWTIHSTWTWEKCKQCSTCTWEEYELYIAHGLGRNVNNI